MNIIRKNSKQILFTLFILFIYCLGSSMTIPGINTELMSVIMEGSSLLNMINMLSGGSLQKMSIFALGVGPYITASIIIQLLSMDVIPYLSEQRQLGNKGQMKLDKITRYLGIVLGVIQAVSLIILFDRSYMILDDKSIVNYIFITTVLVAGMMILLWLGDQITKKGIGNGVSLIIFAGIVSGLPTTFIGLFNNLNGTTKGIIEFILFVLMFLFIIFCVIVMNLSERRIIIQNPSANTVNNLNHLPLKLNSASVVPVIFAQSILMVPLSLLSFINRDLYLKLSDILSFEKPYMLILYAILIVAFTFFYTNLQMNTEDMADNLKKSGSYIPGIRPGKDTQKYIQGVLNRITVFGAIGLTILALIPYVLPMITDLPANISLGGTGIIIVVGVAIETIKQLQTKTYNDKYSNFSIY